MNWLKRIVRLSIRKFNPPSLIETMLFVAILFCIAILLTRCTDATLGGFHSLGSSAHVRCWSGTLPVYDGTSTGKVRATEASDGWEFVDAKTGKFVRVSGTCVVEN